MEDLTFGEQVKIVLGRKGMTIKELAETIEKETGKKMSRQNLTQRLGRDNFQEQDMRLIASILGCPFQLSIMSGEITESAAGRIRKQEVKWNEQEQPEESFSEETVETEKEEQQLTGEERDMTIGEIYDMHEELAELEKNGMYTFDTACLTNTGMYGDGRHITVFKLFKVLFKDSCYSKYIFP